MDAQLLYSLGKALAVVLTIGSACIALAANLPDLGLSRQAVAVLAVAQTGITAALMVLPQVNKEAGTVRGGVAVVAHRRRADTTPPLALPADARAVTIVTVPPTSPETSPRHYCPNCLTAFGPQPAVSRRALPRTVTA